MSTEYMVTKFLWFLQLYFIVVENEHIGDLDLM